MIMKCPVCSGKLDFNFRIRLITCHTCGWKTDFLTKGLRWTITKERSQLTPKEKLV